ncbi:MAG: sigma-54 dependent transcriptional regulator [Acidobacteriota bacterium]|nr:sigma-54 dependent transcriptional regulator [Acidobacteriota bacterium]MDH3784010.1 sigma-54 dependent transcriptional regulator [Acidobacteriota bacterium]
MSATPQDEPNETALPEPSRGRVLVVDDEPVVVDVLRSLLQREGFEVAVAVDAAGGRRRLNDGSWDCLLLDVMLPDADGMELLRWVRERDDQLAVVMITAFGSVQDAVAAIKSGAFHYLTKPFKNDEVRHLVAQAVQSTLLRRENRDLKRALEERYRFEKLVGKSKPMQEVYRFIDQVAPSRATVLIQGESGTGKELVAHAIHQRGTRSSKPFTVVNSVSIPTELLEDNLFGHVRGAFTGATSDRAGLLEASEGGTILFDEITAISPEVQAKLLRAIQNKEYLRLGSTETRSVDVRILAATNEDMEELVREGRFREDLYYRLNVIKITIPPLRQRMEDVPMLLNHFLDRFNNENDKHLEGFTTEAMELFLNYGWQGNVRELENVVERGVVLAGGPRIDLRDLPSEVRGTPGQESSPRLPEGVGLAEAVASFERHMILDALEQSGGVQKKAAARLGLKPTTLNEKLKRLGIRV